MSEKSTIEWTDATWNPVTGCTKVSPGCDHCYAERITNRFQGPGAFDTVVLHPDRLTMPLHWKKPRMVFVNSMSDLFHDDVPDEFIAQVFAVMGYAQRHTFQVLTKRPGRMASLVGSQAFLELVAVVGEGLEDDQWVMHDRELEWQLGPWPLANVWLGTSVETQKWADVRIPKLLETPAAVRFLSCEPLLGPIDLLGARLPDFDRTREREWPGIDWVIVGGESGPGARPMHPDWARSLRDQCVDAGVPFFFKQWGEWAPNRENATVNVLYPDGSSEDILDPDSNLDDPNLAWMFRVGKKAAGRKLDGRTWDEFPDPLMDQLARANPVPRVEALTGANLPERWR